MLVVTGGFPSTSQTFVLNEIASAQKLGWNVHVLSSEPGSETGRKQAMDMGINMLRTTYLDWRRCRIKLQGFRGIHASAIDRETYGFRLALRRNRFFQELVAKSEIQNCQLVHCHFVQWANEVGAGIAKILGVPLTVMAHDSHLANYPTKTLKHLQESATAIVCVSKGWQDLWQSKTGSLDKLIVLHNAINKRSFKKAACNPNIVPRIITVSNCVPRKRPQDLLLAAMLLRERGHDFKLEFVGGGSYFDELRELSKQLGVTSICTFHGAVVHTRVRKLLRQSDIFSLCSEQESFGIATIEAMATGLPTVVSNTSGARDIVIEGKTGYLFEPGDIHTLANKLELLITDTQKRKWMSEHARKRAEEYFCWDKRMTVLDNIWTTAISQS